MAATTRDPGRRPDRLPDPRRAPHQRGDPDRGGHRRRADPATAARPRTPRCRRRDLRRGPRTQPHGRPRIGVHHRSRRHHPTRPRDRGDVGDPRHRGPPTGARRARRHERRPDVRRRHPLAPPIAGPPGGRPGGSGKGPRRPPRLAVHQPIEPDVVAAVQRAVASDDGDVLVFLPGIGEIRRVERALAGGLPAHVDVHALAGALTLEDQDRALAPSPAGRRRVVLSTDIAETSLTVDGVRIVVDAGLAREPRFDARTGLSRLTTVTTSRSSADQRAGRAGRTEPGVAYRLWSKIEHGTRRATARRRSPRPTSPASPSSWRRGAPTQAICASSMRRRQRSLEQARGAARRPARARPDDGSITPLGRSMLGLPVHPRLARMVGDASRSALACIVAALVDERDVLRGRRRRPPGRPVAAGRRRRRRRGHDAADRGAVHRLRDRAADLARAGRHRGSTSTGRRRPHRRCAAARPTPTGSPDAGAHGQFQLRSGEAGVAARRRSAGRRGVRRRRRPRRTGRRSRIRLAAALDAADVIAAFGTRHRRATVTRVGRRS